MPSPSLIPLTSGAYQARSKIANAIVCENLFPEANPQETDAPAPVTHYPREGLRLLSPCPRPDFGRGIFTTSNGALYAVVGAGVYLINPDFSWTMLGQIANARTPVSISDNGTNAVLVDGSPVGYTIGLVSNALQAINDATGLFSGSVRVDYSDTFFGFVQANSNNWYTSLSNQVAFNAFALAAKSGYPDPLVTFGFNLRNAWLIGQKTSEVWFLSGGVPFPYQAWPNVQIPYGCAAPYSLVRTDVDMFWISANKDGQAIAVKTNNMDSVLSISTRGLEDEWSRYRTVADCIGGSFQQGGHTFVIFHFPSANRTWAYDLATKQWHRRVFIDQNGEKQREKVSFYASVNESGKFPRTIVGQDWQTGQIYALDQGVYTDNGQPIVCRRSFPHILSDMKEITHLSFVADFATGGVVGAAEGQPDTPMLSMRYSNDGGETFSNFREKALISAGNYRSMMRWRGLGMARDRVYELQWSFNGPSALNGAYVEPLAHSA